MRLILFLMFLLLSGSALTEEIKFDLDKFQKIETAESKLEYISSVDNKIFINLPFSEYMDFYRALLTSNEGNKKVDKIFETLSTKGHTAHHKHILAVLHTSRAYLKFFYRLELADQQSIQIQTLKAIYAEDETSARQLYKEACSGGLYSSCLFYFYAVNNFNMPCITGDDTNNCEQKLNLLAEAETMYVNALEKQYFAPKNRKNNSKADIARLIAQVYESGVFGIVTELNYPSWLAEHDFPREPVKVKLWQERAAADLAKGR